MTLPVSVSTVTCDYNLLMVANHYKYHNFITIITQRQWPAIIGLAALERGQQELCTLVVILSVILSSREVTFRSPNLNIACSTATSLSPLIKKVTFYRTFVYREPHKVWKVNKVRKTVFLAYKSQIALYRRSVKGLKIFQHIIFKTYV